MPTEDHEFIYIDTIDLPVTARIRRTVILGLIIASFYSLYVTALYIFRGPEVFEKSETTFIGILLAYYAAGIICGVIIGLLLPLTRNIIGALVVYTIAAFFLCVCVISTMSGFISTWRETDWLVCGISTIVFGIVGTYVARKQQNEPF